MRLLTIASDESVRSVGVLVVKPTVRSAIAIVPPGSEIRSTRPHANVVYPVEIELSFSQVGEPERNPRYGDLHLIPGNSVADLSFVIIAESREYGTVFGEDRLVQHILISVPAGRVRCVRLD